MVIYDVFLVCIVTNNLRKESYKWRVDEILNARRLAETNKSLLMNLMPVPEEVALPDLPPDWSMIPLCQHIPMPTMAPPGKVEFTRGSLGENILRNSKTFDLGDPYCHDLKIEYDPIHDPYLKHFLLAPHVKKYIEDLGVVTEDNKVKCNARSYNAYRHYMWTVQRNGIKEKLLMKERQQQLKKRFIDFLNLANHVKAEYLKVGLVEKEITTRQFVKKFNIMLENMLQELRKKESEAGTAKVQNQKNDKWIIHLVKDKHYPEVKALYKNRAFAASAHKGVKFVLKWRDHYIWEAEREDLMERCRQLKQLTRDLYWERKVAEQILLLKRDFLIFNDYLAYSTRRMRNRERWYNMDRLAMKGKFKRLRYDRDYSIVKKWQKNRKYGMAADFLMNNLRLAPLANRAWELQPRKKPVYNPRRKRKYSGIKSNLARVLGRPAKVGGLEGKLLTGRTGKRVAGENFFYMINRFAYRAVKVACATQLTHCRRQLKCMVARLRHRMTLPGVTTKDLIKRYNWSRKLPYRAVAENWHPKVIVRKKLVLAIRRFMKHERRRIRAMKKFPEWSYYEKKATKYKSKNLIVPSKWRKLKLYFPLIREQYHVADWKGSCKSLGKYLLYVLVNNESLAAKRKKICSHRTAVHATLFKIKSKARIVVDVIKRIISKKIRLHYPEEIRKHIGIARGHVRRLLPRNPKNGDGYVKSLSIMVAFMSLSHINFQHIGPFADKFMLYICYPKKFPLRFKKYRIDQYKKKQLYQTIYPYKTNQLANLEYYQKITKIINFRKKYEKDPELMMQVYDPKLQKYILLYKNITLARYIEF